MTIAEVREKCKSFRDVIIIGVLVLASSLSFGLGYLAGLEAGQGSPTLETPPSVVSSIATTSATGQVVASKGGTKYYVSGCAGALRIADANKVWFVSASAAEAAGYAPAVNCK
ncbi:MAG: hypothetical protein ACYC6X_03115 [Minisyncoccota bacterium]